MSDNNLHKIFAPTACVSTERMIDYLNGNLSEKEKNRLEVHFSSCEMCRDEFEGLSLMQNRIELDKIVVDLHHKIENRINSEGQKKYLFKPFYRIAAVIIILFASGWFLKLYTDSSSKMFSDETVSQAIEEVSQTESEAFISKDTMNAFTRKLDEAPKLERELDSRGPEETAIAKDKQSLDRTKLLTTEKNEAQEVELMDEEIAEDELEANNTNAIVLSENNAKTKTAETNLKSNEIAENTELKVVNEEIADKKKEERSEDFYNVADDEKVDYNVTRGNRKQNKKLAKADDQQLPSLSNTVSINNFDLALAQYNQREYKQAIELFKMSLNQHDRADEVYYYLAKSYYNTNDTENALSSYNKVIAERSGPYYEEALWNKSQILLEMNKKKSAINSFNQVKKHKGSYSRRASQILDSLKSK